MGEVIDFAKALTRLKISRAEEQTRLNAGRKRFEKLSDFKKRVADIYKGRQAIYVTPRDALKHVLDDLYARDDGPFGMLIIFTNHAGTEYGVYTYQVEQDEIEDMTRWALEATRLGDNAPEHPGEYPGYPAEYPDDWTDYDPDCA